MVDTEGVITRVTGGEVLVVVSLGAELAEVEA